ncbi:hypothetical protein [Paractinoplanes maris]|uniref:hypothetical protein n=1 Tax=Paractinoplanes maris TaxID=1734446 RepID=UPI002020DAEB|nr:hypothetical protein [Actinoplanes maris]
MTPMDEDLIAVRNLPPGVVEPSDESLARVRQRVFAQPAPRHLAWRLTMRRFWVPVAAAAAVLLVVGVGLASLRPRALTPPQPEPVSSEPARVRRVFDELITAAGRKTPFRPRAGQLVYQNDEIVEISPLDGRPFRRSIETWIEPATTTYLGSAEEGLTDPGRASAAWEQENAKDRYRSLPLGKRPFLKLTSFLAGPTDPAAARRDLIDRVTVDVVSEDEQVWSGIWEMVILDALLPAERRVALYQLLRDLPVSVGETGVDGRRLVIVRFAAPAGSFLGFLGPDKAYDLLIDPVSGEIAGTQVLHDGPAPAWSPPDNVEVQTGPSGLPWSPAPLPAGPIDPALVNRHIYNFGLVEDIGDLP